MRDIKHYGNTCVNGKTNFVGHMRPSEAMKLYRMLEKMGARYIAVREYGYPNTLNMTQDFKKIFKWSCSAERPNADHLVEFTLDYDQKELFVEAVMALTFSGGKVDYSVEPWRR